MAPPMTKEIFRRELRSARKFFYAQRGPEASAAIALRLQTWIKAAGFSGTLFGYWPVHHEPDLSSISRSSAVNMALPQVLDAKDMIYRAYAHGDPLLQSKMGILEPTQGRVLTPGKGDLMIMPALGFTRTGYRLGYGAGYYDRYLAGIKDRPLTMIVSFDVCLLDEGHVLFDAHDIRADLILTESGIITIQAGAAP